MSLTIPPAAAASEPGRTPIRSLAGLEISRIAGPRRIKPAERPGFLLVLAEQGGIACSRLERPLAHNEAAILGGDDGAELLLDEGAVITIVRIPESVAGPHVEAFRAALHRPFAAESGTAALVAQLLSSLADQPEDDRSEHEGRLAHYVVGLISLMCLSTQESDVSWRTAILRRAMDHIEDRLGDLDLCPDSVAAAQNISTRTLHRVFERDGLTVSGWIRARRLERCRQDLEGVAYADLPVSAIGARWGLWDAAHFSRLFKATFGTSPRLYRSQALATGGSPELH